jgi:hypothetical protein
MYLTYANAAWPISTLIGLYGVDSCPMKPKQSLLAAAILLMCANAASAQVGVLPQKDTTLQDARDEKFKVGDVWEYETRKGEERSTITIVKVDNSPELGIIVHVAVDNVRLANCNGGPSPTAIPHMPFTRRALEASVTKKIASEQPLPNYREGYEEWKEAYLNKKAGIYVVPVAKAVTVAEETYRSGIGCN